jgi:transcriptional regulator with XRE-family HTH domain
MKLQTNVLRDFILFVKQRHGWSESEIARRTNLSQSAISKIVVGGGVRRPDLETYRALCGTLAADWGQFLRTNPKHAQEVAEAFFWAVPGVMLSPINRTEDPEAAEAAALLDDILSNCSAEARTLLLTVLRSFGQASGRAQTGRRRHVRGTTVAC